MIIYTFVLPFQQCINTYLQEKYGEFRIEESLVAATKIADTKYEKEVAKLMNTAFFTVKEDLAFAKYPKLHQLQQKNGMDLSRNYLANKACSRFVSSIANDMKNNLGHNVSNTCFISILTDGSTDSGILEQEIVYVRYLNENNKPITQFAGLKNPMKADALGIISAIEDVMKSLNVSELSDEEYLEAVYKKLVNGNFDGVSVMSRNKSDVQARLKEKQPGMVYTHCTAHRLELAMLDCIKSDQYLPKFDDYINKIFKFYFKSANRWKELYEISSWFEENFKSFGLLKNIRWIASRARALNLLEKNYKILIYDLENKSYGSSKTSEKALGYVEFLKTPEFLFYLHFLQDVVGVLRPLSLAFQKDDLLICHVPSKVEETKSLIDILIDVPGDAYSYLLNELTDDVNEGHIVYKGTVLKKPTGRRARQIENTSQSFKEHFADTFEKVISAVQDYLDTRFSDFDKTLLKEMV